MTYKEMELKKQKNMKTIVFIAGIFFFPIWLLNIGRGKLIKQLEREVRREKNAMYEYKVIPYELGLSRGLHSGEIKVYEGRKVADFYVDMTQLKIKEIELWLEK